jgi:radical SAM superfamily enzyme YgiQ (UPF0313 family)
MARADTMDQEMLIALKEAGLYALKYGVESGSQQLLNKAGKNLDLQKVKKTIRLTREVGIKYHLTFMFGLPGETWKTVEETIQFALEADPNSLQWSMATPFPGSRFYEMMEDKGYLVSKDFNEYDGCNRSVVRTDDLSAADLEKALRLAQKRWNQHLFFKELRTRKMDYVKYGIQQPLQALRRLKEILI